MPKAKAKLPGATVTNALDFCPTDEFWAVADKHMGQLSEDNRNQLVRIVYSYYSSVQFELNAADLNMALKRLQDIEKAANAFWQALMPGWESDPAREANHHVEHLINQALARGGRSFFLGPPLIPDEERYVVPHSDSDPESENPDDIQEWVRRDWCEQRLRDFSVDQMVHTMTAFVIACDQAAREMGSYSDGRYYRPGESWERLIKNLTFFWLDLGMVVTAAKRSDPDKPPSPFVAFASDLQAQFPPDFRRSTQSLEALESNLSKIVPRAKEEWQDAKRKERTS
ncbi:hypothetical protein [Microvirga sesbaniae]|uniref:hypothetical protein n=1 Tax=Microvirga sesbaniae TaxID=681392 RepID=UPI0021C6E8CE|nr:hypothetical protein [Microvirga sp. HBU67692]